VSFHEGYAPLPESLGIAGGPERATEIIALASGKESRNLARAHARRRYEIGGVIASLDEAADLIAFFEARRGRWQGFRFRDPADGASCPPSHTPGPLDQSLGEGDGAARIFVLHKAYGDYRRPIVKPVAGSVRVAIDGVETGAFALDATRGVVTFDTPPQAGAALTAGFSFDTPVRFDVDRLSFERAALGRMRLGPTALVEIL
jgi:uncharacterized protein (TIGR02217 family)